MKFPSLHGPVLEFGDSGLLGFAIIFDSSEGIQQTGVSSGQYIDGLNTKTSEVSAQSVIFLMQV